MNVLDISSSLSEKQQQIITNTIQSMKGLNFKEAEAVVFELLQQVKTVCLINL